MFVLLNKFKKNLWWCMFVLLNKISRTIPYTHSLKQQFHVDKLPKQCVNNTTLTGLKNQYWQQYIVNYMYCMNGVLISHFPCRNTLYRYVKATKKHLQARTYGTDNMFIVCLITETRNRLTNLLWCLKTWHY